MQGPTYKMSHIYEILDTYTEKSGNDILHCIGETGNMRLHNFIQIIGGKESEAKYFISE